MEKLIKAIIGCLIALFLGWCGGYRFYKKQKKMGFLYLFTIGLFGFGWFYDILTSFVEIVKVLIGMMTLSKVPNMPSVENTYTSPAAENITRSVNTKSEGEFFYHLSKDTEKNISQLKERFIAIDTETTGLSATTDRIVSIGAVIYENGKQVHEFYSLVNPERHISEEASRVNGITDDMVKDAPSEHDVCRQLLEFCGDAVFGRTLFIAYNAKFDAKFIKEAMNRNGFAGNIRIFDTWAYAKKKLDLPGYKQTEVAEHLGISTKDAHNSLADCKICAEITMALLDK